MDISEHGHGGEANIWLLKQRFSSPMSCGVCRGLGRRSVSSVVLRYEAIPGIFVHDFFVSGFLFSGVLFLCLCCQVGWLVICPLNRGIPTLPNLEQLAASSATTSKL